MLQIGRYWREINHIFFVLSRISNLLEYKGKYFKNRLSLIQDDSGKYKVI